MYAIRSYYERLQGLEVVAPDLDGEALIAPEDPLQHELSLGGPGTDPHPGDPAGEAPSQVVGDGEVGSLPLRSGGQGDP